MVEREERRPEASGHGVCVDTFSICRQHLAMLGRMVRHRSTREHLARFRAAEQGSGVMTYMILTGCWAALMAVGLQIATPKVAFKMQMVSKELRVAPSR